MIPEEIKLLVKHTADSETREDLGIFLITYIAVELTKICIQYNKSPREILELFEEIKSSLV